DFFRGRGGLADVVDRLLETDEIAVCGPVVTELRRGLRSRAERLRIPSLAPGLPRAGAAGAPLGGGWRARLLPRTTGCGGQGERAQDGDGHDLKRCRHRSLTMVCTSRARAAPRQRHPHRFPVRLSAGRADRVAPLSCPLSSPATRPSTQYPTLALDAA